MYCWGSTENGELGLGGSEVEQVLLPKYNDFSSSWHLKRVAPGLNHTLFLTEDGQVYSCGNNEFGQLGHNKPNRRPEHIDTLEGYNITEIAAGDQHSLALTSWGEVYSWGENGFGQLGLNTSEPHCPQPSLIKTLAKKRVIQISCGVNHSLALTIDNEVYAWGQNISGQLGLSHKESPIREPHAIKVLTSIPIKLVMAGGHHSTTLTNAGFLLTWGSNKYGQLGRPTSDISSSATPSLVPNLATYSEALKYVAVGENHTAVLDANGKLWTFGYGRYGQLGHGKFADNPTPQPVLDLVGTKVDQVACGRCHTLVYISTQAQVYSFGQGMSGQLGHKSAQNRNTPDTVIGPWRAPNGRSVSCLDFETEEKEKIYIDNIFAGGDSSFVCVSKSEVYGPDFGTFCPYQYPYIIYEEKIDQMIDIGEEDMLDDDLFSYCEDAVGSPGCWNGSFLKVGPSSKADHCLNYRKAEEYMAKLGQINRDSLSEMVKCGIEKVAKELPSNLLTPEALRLFIILPLWKEFGNVKKSASLLGPFAKALLSLDVISSVTYRRWLHTLPLDYLRLLLGHYKKTVVHIMKLHHNKESVLIMNPTLENDKRLLLSSLNILDLLYKENKTFTGKENRLSCEEFYIAEIADAIDIKKDYLQWLSNGARGVNWTDRVCFCEYSFLFDSKAKTILLRVDAARQMQGAITEAVHQTNPLMWFFNPNEVQFMTVHVRRDNLVSDTLCQIDSQPYSNLKKPLKIHFIGEEAEDAGGVRKEFFLLVLNQILNPDYGMFNESSETKTIWFRRGALEVDSMYTLIGIVCGLAIYNFTIINLPFPSLLYKKLLDEPVDLDDFSEMEPTVAKGFKHLLDYDGDDVEDVFGLNFTATVDHFGEAQIVPLKPSGETIPVTADNKQEYVDLMVDWILNKSVETQYRCFHNGFHRVCGGGVLKLFQSSELMALVTGNENYDWEEFQNIAVYKGQYSSEHPTIQMFWDVFHGLTKEQKKKFLLFLTGCDRIPIMGMKSIKMTIESTRDTNFLPVAHTCVAQLDLPNYTTKEKLKYKLVQAIQQTEGFGLV